MLQEGPKANKVLKYMVVVAIMLSAMLVLAVLWPQDTKSPEDEVYFGYLEYEVAGVAFFIPFTGTVRAEVFNVTEDGYWARITVEGIPGGQSKTQYYDWEETPAYVSDIGVRTGNETVETPWGTKVLERYDLENNGTLITSYLGVEPRIVYKVVAEGSGIQVVMTLVETDIDEVRTGNG